MTSPISANDEPADVETFIRQLCGMCARSSTAHASAPQRNTQLSDCFIFGTSAISRSTTDRPEFATNAAIAASDRPVRSCQFGGGLRATEAIERRFAEVGAQKWHLWCRSARWSQKQPRQTIELCGFSGETWMRTHAIKRRTESVFQCSLT
jgi:hypothetical protein